MKKLTVNLFIRALLRALSICFSTVWVIAPELIDMAERKCTSKAILPAIPQASRQPILCFVSGISAKIHGPPDALPIVILS